jgi:hypothetical protein
MAASEPVSTSVATSGISRDRQLDLLRGVAVAGMFFFSVVATLSDSLPLFLAHNVQGHLLPGDFVLSLFLFCSGISLAMVSARYQSLRVWEMWRKLGVRLLQMLAVSLFVTPFSTGTVLGMDEMMLNAVLTIPALLIIIGGRWCVWLVTVFTWLAQVGLLQSHTIVESSGVYLGGYSCAVFWLPILLGGALVMGVPMREMLQQLGAWCLLCVVATLVSGWPDKMSLNVSFGVCSVILGVVLLVLFRRFSVRCEWLEYFGSKPLRMWGLMFCLLGPVRLYAEVEAKQLSLSLSPVAAVAGSVAWMGCCFLLSKWWDVLTLKQRPSPHASVGR